MNKDNLNVCCVLMFFLIPVYCFVSCVDTINNDKGAINDEIRQINRSVESQKWICDGIEEPVYYRGRKIYNGAHTRYYRYQSAKTGAMYRPKKKPVCQELGERPFTQDHYDRINALKAEMDVIDEKQKTKMWWCLGLWLFFTALGVYIQEDEM